MALTLIAAAPVFLDTKVSLSKTESVSALLRDLSAATKTELLVSDARGKEILIVSVKDVPLNDVMKKIAWATYGRWETVRGGYRLVRDSDAEKAAQKKYIQWQSSEASDAIKVFQARVLTKGMESDPGWRPPGTSLGKAGRLDRAIARLLGAVPAERTLFLDRYDLHTFSSQPIAGERPLSNWAEVLRQYNAETAPNGMEPAVRGFLTCQYKFEVGYASLRLYDARGQQIESKDVRFALYDPDQSAVRPKEFADRIPADAPVPLSAESKFLIRAETPNSWGTTPDERAKVPDVVERLQNPERYEPMATFATDAWRAVGKSIDANVVANVDDCFMAPTWTRYTPKLGEAFKLTGGYNAETQPGWLLARPSLATPPWPHRMDRAALGRLARTRWTTQEAAFQAWSEFAGAQDSTPDYYNMSLFLGWVGAPSPDPMEGWSVARIFGLARPDVLESWMRGTPVPFSRLSDEMRLAIRDYSLKTEGTSPESFDREPSIRFPQGLPQRGWLTASSDQSIDYVIRSKQPDGSYGAGRWRAAELRQYFRSLQKQSPGELAKFDVMEIPQSTLRFMAAFSEKDGLLLKTLVREPNGATPYIPWGQIPDDMRARILGTN